MDDEWWDESKENSVSKDETIPPSKKEKRAKKRKTVREDKDDETATGDNKDEGEATINQSTTCSELSIGSTGSETETQRKKKKRRKMITEELEKRGKSFAKNEDFIESMNKHYHEKLSPVERDEITLDSDVNFFAPNESKTTSLYLGEIIPNWENLVKRAGSGTPNTGSPLLLIICPSAIRAVDVIREISDFKGEKCKCAKLFAKHFKLQEQHKYLSKTSCHIGVGTPSRIGGLLKLGSLRLNQLVAIVIDWNWRDKKLKRLIDIKDVRKETMELLKSTLVPHVKQSDCKIGLL